MQDLAFLKARNNPSSKAAALQQKIETLEEDWKKLRTALVDVRSIIKVGMSDTKPHQWELDTIAVIDRVLD